DPDETNLASRHCFRSEAAARIEPASTPIAQHSPRSAIPSPTSPWAARIIDRAVKLRSNGGHGLATALRHLHGALPPGRAEPHARPRARPRAGRAPRPLGLRRGVVRRAP